MPVKAYRELILSPSITNTHLNKTMRVFENIPKPGFLKIFVRITRIPHSDAISPLPKLHIEDVEAPASVIRVAPPVNESGLTW